jgi:hypothetical protein
MSHVTPRLWSIHAIHHMSHRVTASNNARHHFLDNGKVRIGFFFVFFDHRSESRDPEALEDPRDPHTG